MPTRKLLEGSPGSPWRRIGEAELVAGRTFHDRSFECAAWWQDVICEPQTVEVQANGYWVIFRFSGAVTAADFHSYFGGVPVGTYDSARDVGRKSASGFQLYCYNVAEAILEGRPVAGDDVVVRLDPDVSIVGTYHIDIREEPFLHFAVEAGGA
jgi:hypothetical protein